MREIVAQVVKELAVSRGEAELIVASLLEKPRFEIYLNDSIDQESRQFLRAKLMQLKNGMPLEYVRKRMHFMDYSLRIYPGVFIPRFETEYFIELIEKLIDFVPEQILDIGTGTGAISIALAHLYPDVHIVATDISDKAIRCARENIKEYGLTDRIHLLQCSICNGVNTRFDLIISNPPYIPSSRLHSLPKSVRDFEPMLAIDGGQDGIQFIKLIIQQTAAYQNPGGIIALEIDEDTVITIKEFLQTNGYDQFSFRRDQFGKYRYLFIGELKDEKSKNIN
ncbi:MAG: peptide chain release factor N(5)-glutamine methyltransferase [bacterium]